ncbi:MAG: OmpA family protein [Nitrospirae bacterium]|nr:OmpA family protein [Nitrospirota bacterium]
MARRVDINISSETESHWVSATDLMSGLMLVFMLIAISYMINSSEERDRMREVAVKWAQTKDDIYKSLNDEFAGDLKKWHAEIERESLTIRFKEPTILFQSGQSRLTPRFCGILCDFFPRYLRVLKQYDENISEIRIEGHTSTEWSSTVSDDEAYINNMILSQERTIRVLMYCLANTKNKELHAWGERVIIGSGMSSSRTIQINNKEDRNASRRVEFRVRTNADEKLTQIYKELQPTKKINK